LNLNSTYLLRAVKETVKNGATLSDAAFSTMKHIDFEPYKELRAAAAVMKLSSVKIFP